MGMSPQRRIASQANYTESDPNPIPALLPDGSGRLSHLSYRSVRFYGQRLADALAETVQYLEYIEKVIGGPPHTLCVHDEFSWEDAGSDLAWQVTLVFSEEINEGPC
jgi:hypothetical protein